MSPTFHVLLAYFVGFGLFLIYAVMLFLSRETVQRRANARVNDASLPNQTSD